MPTHVHIPAGAVQPRPVRPLTAEEAARIYPPATPAQLDGLALAAQARRLDAKRPARRWLPAHPPPARR